MQNLKTIYFLNLLIVVLNSNAWAKNIIRIDDETLCVFEEQYRIFNERNAQKFANREIAQQIYHSPDPTKDLFQNTQTVVMPICDFARPPFEWKYIAPSQEEQVLKYVGGHELGSQFLKWTDSVWMRLAGSKEKFREGMYCGAPLSQTQGLQNFVTISIDNSFAENIKSKNTPTDLIDGALLQLASRSLEASERLMRGEVQFGVSPELGDVRVSLEIWAMSANNSILLARVSHGFWARVDSGIQKISVEAKVAPGNETHLVFKLDPILQERAAQGQALGKIFIMDARLQPM